MTTRVLQSLAVFAAMVGTSLAADLNSIMEHAKNVQMDAQQISTALKSKNFDTNEVKNKIEATQGRINNLKEAVAAYEAANPGAANSENWKAVKDRVTLLEIFASRKAELLTDAQRNRSMLRAHADGIAKRAVSLQETTARLQQVSTSSSGS
ncbi:MAG: hypothetical protein JNN08_19970 [Bryobacterales bacterium]|nr:hypothetical protein [Bryobacterales bacterium]